MHLEVVQERIEREFGLSLITTAPTVVFEVELVNGDVEHIDNPSKLPPVNEVAELREPIISPDVTYFVETERAAVALTIDDGPDPVATRA